MAWQDAGSPLNANATGAAGAAITATMQPKSNMTPYLQGFVVTSQAPAATVSGTITVSGVVNGPLTYQFVESTTFGGELPVEYPDPKGIQGIGQGVPITIALSAIASGGIPSIAATGYQL